MLVSHSPLSLMPGKALALGIPSQGRSEQAPGPTCAEDVYGVVSVMSAAALICH